MPFIAPLTVSRLPVVVSLQIAAVIHQHLDDLVAALVRGAVQRRAAVFVMDVRIDAQVQAAS